MGDNKNERLLKKYQHRLEQFHKEKEIDDILTSLKNGKNSYMRLDRLESSSFEDSWIKTIEDCLFDLGDIITNPRSVTKTDANVVPVELAKKINGDSVQHLASHTQFIKDIDEEGNVIPNKLLSMSNEDDIHTYENRFIATFIRRLVLFVEKRYEYVKHFSPLHNEEVLYVKNHSFVDGAEVEIETKIKIRSEAADDNAILSSSYIERIKHIREYILYYYNSPFMKALKTDKNVRKPILQTNIIRKNPKYHHCFEVFSFIEKYEKLGVDYKLKETYSLFNDEELNELNQMSLVNYLTVKGKFESKNNKSSSKVYKPKILTSMDDESFVYGPYLSGPVEFIRIDPKFREYVDKKAKVTLPLHPNKKERLYYKEEYDYKKENASDNKELDGLIKRKQKEAADFDKKALKIIEEREREEAELERLRLLKIKEEEQRRIEERRQKLINAALGEKERIKVEKEENNAESEEILPEEPTSEESPVVEEAPIVEEPVKEEEVAEVPVEAVEEVKAQVEEPAPVEETVVEEVNEPQIEEIPVVEAPIAEVNEQKEENISLEKKKQRKPRTKKAPKEPKVVVAAEPKEEIKESQAIETPVEVVEEAPMAEEPAQTEEIPVIEATPIVETPKEEATEEPVEKIPGRFIVKANEGYYVAENKFSVYKHDAKIFLDFVEANKLKKELGGKVVKL